LGSPNTGAAQDDTDCPFLIGACGALGSVAFLNSLLDDPRLYRRPLTTQEVHDLHDSAILR